MTEAERNLLLLVAEKLADDYPDSPFGSVWVSELHSLIKAVKEETPRT